MAASLVLPTQVVAKRLEANSEYQLRYLFSAAGQTAVVLALGVDRNFHVDVAQLHFGV